MSLSICVSFFSSFQGSPSAQSSWGVGVGGVTFWCSRISAEHLITPPSLSSVHPPPAHPPDARRLWRLCQHHPQRSGGVLPDPRGDDAVQRRAAEPEERQADQGAVAAHFTGDGNVLPLNGPRNKSTALLLPPQWARHRRPQYSDKSAHSFFICHTSPVCVELFCPRTV